MTRKLLLTTALIISCSLPFPVFAQKAAGSHPDETTTQIPVLTDFHEVIFKLWHTAWPEKNFSMLVGLLPEITHFSDSLAKVQLPGILRDKQNAWMSNTAKLRAIVTEYAKATSPVDSQKLLDAAEQLHAQYETLVRVTRPVLKELDAFHQVLYMLYHHYLPDNDQKKILSSVIELKEKMTELNKAKLSDRMKKKEAAFEKSRTTLSRSVEALDSSMATENPKEFASRVEVMHADYQALERVFE